MSRLKQKRIKSRLKEAVHQRRVSNPSLKSFAPDCVDQVYLIAAAGWSDDEIAAICGISPKKLSAWRNLYPDLDKAISEGRMAPDMEVVKAAWKSAVGYTVPRKVRTVTTDPDGGETVSVRTEEVAVPPNPASIKFWATNRMGWKDKREAEVTVTHELGDRLERALERVGRGHPPLEGEATEVTQPIELLRNSSDPQLPTAEDDSADT